MFPRKCASPAHSPEAGATTRPPGGIQPHD
jgi:hypothetical protein